MVALIRRVGAMPMSSPGRRWPRRGRTEGWRVTPGEIRGTAKMLAALRISRSTREGASCVRTERPPRSPAQTSTPSLPHGMMYEAGCRRAPRRRMTRGEESESPDPSLRTGRPSGRVPRSRPAGTGAGDAIRTFEPPSLNPTFWRVTERVLFYEAEDEVHVALRAEPLGPQELEWVG